MKCLQKVIGLDPNNVLGLVALGNVYLEKCLPIQSQGC